MSDFSELPSDVIAAVIGDPITHSKSPIMHNSWLKKAGIEGKYTAIHVRPEELRAFAKVVRDSNMRGFNATLPHKEALIELCDELDDDAAAIGAVNTVSNIDGMLIGSNTDAFGFIQNIKNQHPDFDFTSGPVLLIGAGGAAKAVLYGLLQEGVSEIFLTNRTREKAEASAKLDKHIHVVDWEKRDEYVDKAGLIVNTTSLGMAGKPVLELNLDGITPQTLVSDIVYAPLETALLREATEKGAHTATGVGMLIEQGRKSFHHWFGVWPEPDQKLEDQLLELSS